MKPLSSKWSDRSRRRFHLLACVALFVAITLITRVVFPHEEPHPATDDSNHTGNQKSFASSSHNNRPDHSALLERPGSDPQWCSPQQREGSASPQKEVRILFFGDSLTEGINRGNVLRDPLPRGLCSYRYPALERLAARMKQHACSPSVQLSEEEKGNNKVVFVRPVGPFEGGVAGIPSNDCRLSLRSHPWIHAPSMHRHAATWGASIRTIKSDADIAELRRGNFKRAFRKKLGKLQVPMDTSLTQGATNTRKDSSPAARWMRVYDPHLVTLLLGTNDLSIQREPLQLLTSSLPWLLQELLMDRSGGGGGPNHHSNELQQQQQQEFWDCRRRLLLIKLLPRRDDVHSQRLVELVNAVLTVVDDCRPSKIVNGSSNRCASCVKSRLRNVALSTSTHFGTKLIPAEDHIAQAWCALPLRCIDIADVSPNEEASVALALVRDKLHLSSEGETMVGERLGEELWNRYPDLFRN